MKRAGDERGQVIVLTVLLMASLLGAGALVLDAGAWFRSSRVAQQTADAAALAGSQALPEDTAAAKNLALQYATSNGGGVAAADVTFETTYRANDTIDVNAHRTEQGFLSPLFGINSVNLNVIAKAVATTLSQAKFVAPFVVDHDHPMLKFSNGCPCFQQQTTLSFTNVGPGAFGVLNLANTKGGTSPGALESWITSGYPDYLGLGWYYDDPGAKFDSSQIKNALDGRIGSELLFPVHDGIQGNGANFQFHIIGWVGFHLTGYNAQGSAAQLFGWFTQIIWEGLPDTSSNQPDWGAHTISLVQ